MSIKKRFLYFGIPFTLFGVGIYFLNYAGVNHYHKNILTPVVLSQKNFNTFEPVPVNQINQNKNNIHKIESEYNKEKINEQNDILVLFSPRDDIRSFLIRYIEKEEVGIICAAFRLTDPLITKAFLSAYERGVNLNFIVDKEGLSTMHSKVLHLFSLGIPVFVFPPIGSIDESAIPGLMHNKILIFVGQRVVITGSFNYTKSAQERNRENIVIIKNNDVLFDQYINEINLIMKESSRFQTRDIKKQNKRIKNKRNNSIKINNKKYLN